MKKTNIFASLALMMMFAACSSDNDVIEENNKNFDTEEITIGVGMPGDNNTRASFGESVGELLWSPGDVLMCVGRSEGKPIYPSEFAINPMVTDPVASASFTGKVLTDETYKYEFAYVGGDDYQNIHVTYDYENNTWDCKYLEQVQEGLNNFKKLKNHLFMISDPLSKADLVGETPVVLHHKSSIMKINIKNYADVIANSEEFDVNLYFNYVENGTNTPAAKVHLSAYGGLTTGDNFLYMAFDPANKLEKDGVIAAEFISKADNTVKCIARGTSTNGKQYVAGKVYTLTAGKADTNLIWDAPADPGDEPADNSVLLYQKVFDTEDSSTNPWNFKSYEYASRNYKLLETPLYTFANNSMSIKPNMSGTFYVISEAFHTKGTFNQGTSKGYNKVILTYSYTGAASGVKDKTFMIGGRAKGDTSSRGFKQSTDFKLGASESDITVEFQLKPALNGKDIEICFKVVTSSQANTVDATWNIKKIEVRGSDEDLPKAQ